MIDHVTLTGDTARELYDAVRDYARTKSWPWFTKPFDLNLWGFRTTGKLGAWDDALVVLYTDDDGQPCVFVARATTDPGREGTGTRRDGVAVVPDGYHKALWRRGVHKRGTPSEHVALVQARPLMVGRDAVVDGKPVGLGQSAAHGINCHRPWRDNLPTVGDASHGCTVTRTKAAHDEVMRLYDEQVEHGRGELVSYALTSDPTLVGLVAAVLG